MAKVFNNLKQGIDLFDTIGIGKYKGCRLDSIIEQDPEYLIYMDGIKAMKFSEVVIDKLKPKFNGFIVTTPTYNTNWYSDDWDDDIPF